MCLTQSRHLLDVPSIRLAHRNMIPLNSQRPQLASPHWNKIKLEFSDLNSIMIWKRACYLLRVLCISPWLGDERWGKGLCARINTTLQLSEAQLEPVCTNKLYTIRISSEQILNCHYFDLVNICPCAEIICLSLVTIVGWLKLDGLGVEWKKTFLFSWLFVVYSKDILRHARPFDPCICTLICVLQKYPGRNV